MPWAFCRANRLVAAGYALLIWPAWPDRALAEPRWRHGVFPVVQFLGYTSHFGGGSDRAGFRSTMAAWTSPRRWVLRSAAGGGVVQAVVNDGRCGLGVVIRSGEYDHLYCHLAGQVSGRTYTSGPLRLVVGQPVRTGQVIGHVGMSGRTTGPHLHWAISYRGRWLDPGVILRAMAISRSSRQLRP